MYTFSTCLNKKEYDKFIENYSMASFMQEYNWANVKDNWKSFHCGLYNNKKLIGVCLILVKKVLKNINIFYIPRGYLIDFTNYNDLKAMTDNIKALAKKNKAYVVKIDPNFCISEKNLKNNPLQNNYSKDYQIKHNNLLKLGYKWTGKNKEIGKNLQPQYNIFAPVIDKDNNILKIEDVLKTYKSKFRYYLGDYGKKRGISYEIQNGDDYLDIFVNLLKKTEEKQNISLRNKEYYKKILANFKGRAFIFFGNLDIKKYIGFLKESNMEEEVKKIVDLFKDKKSVTLSTGLLLLPLNKNGIRTSEYLYAGNDNILNNLNVSAGLVFEMIKFSIENKCHYCNLGGVDGNLSDHLTIFKQKFNGSVMEFAGEYDLPIEKKYYLITLLYPFLIKIYKKIRKK